MKKLFDFIAKKVWNQVGVKLTEGITSEESLLATYKVISEHFGDEFAEEYITSLLETKGVDGKKPEEGDEKDIESEKWGMMTQAEKDHVKKKHKVELEEADGDVQSVLNSKITNPDTGRQIKVKSGLSYDKNTGGYQAAKSKMQDAGISDDEIEKATSSSDDTDTDSEKSKSEKKAELVSKDHETTDKQLMMTKKEAAAQAKQKGLKGVGAGTPESRAGEAMVHKGLRLMQDGKSIEEITQYFDDIVNSKDHILNSSSGKKWVKSAASTLKKLNETIGSENIDTVSWDTPEGRTAIGVDPNLETSSDMFVRTKDGKNVGISLKKDGAVFLNNGGWAKQSELLLNGLEGTMSKDDHKRLSDAMSINAYKKDLEDRFKYVTNTVGVDEIKQSFKKLLDNPDDQAQFKGSNRDSYFEILSKPEELLDRINSGTATGNDQKAYSKLLQTYHSDEYKHLRESDNGLTQRAFDAINASEGAKRGMKSHIIKSMHISETLGLNKTIKDGGVDEFMTTYGIDPDGAVLNEKTLVTLFGKRFKNTLDEALTEVRNGTMSKKELDTVIQDSIEIDYDSGQILFKHENNKKYPLFFMQGRTRGIGSSPIMEMAQTPLMAHALKQGTFNTDDWDEKSLKRFKSDIIDMKKQENN
jgi:hypothetical protein